MPYSNSCDNCFLFVFVISSAPAAISICCCGLSSSEAVKFNCSREVAITFKLVPLSFKKADKSAISISYSVLFSSFVIRTVRFVTIPLSE